jgi:putative hemolysin
MFLTPAITASLAVAASPAIAAPHVSAAHATTAKPLVEINTVGGFVAPAWSVSRLPRLTILANGTVFIENPKPNHGYVRDAAAGSISVPKARDFANQLLALAKTPKGGWGFPGVADVPNTAISVNLAGRSFKTSVYALEFTNGVNMKSAQAAARKALASALTNFQKALPKAAAYSPSVYEVWGLTQAIGTGKAGSMGMPNPASVYCASIGGEVGTIQTAAGEAGTCQLPSGDIVDEWDNFRSALATLPSWPAGYTVPGITGDFVARCTAISTKAISKQLANTDDQGRWLLPSGQAFPVVLRAVLPGERACHRVD